MDRKNTSTSSAKQLSWKSDVLVLFATTSLVMPPKLLLFLSYSHALTIATLGWSPSVLGRQTSESPKMCSLSCSPRTSHVHVTPILRHLHWLPVRAGISYKIACLCFSAITSSTPVHLSDLLHLYSPSRSVRFSADTRLLKIPLYKRKKKGDRAFSYFGPSVWNSLPLHIRTATTIDTLRSALKTYPFNLQESD